MGNGYVRWCVRKGNAQSTTLQQRKRGWLCVVFGCALCLCKKFEVQCAHFIPPGFDAIVQAVRRTASDWVRYVKVVPAAANPGTFWMREVYPSLCPSGWLEGAGVVTDKGAAGCTAVLPCGLCEGDCDTDEDCAGRLLCFQRGAALPDVPGCAGDGYVTSGEAHDYCYDPLAALEVGIRAAGDAGPPPPRGGRRRDGLSRTSHGAAL